jgi:hypothetical protein
MFFIPLFYRLVSSRESRRHAEAPGITAEIAS